MKLPTPAEVEVAIVEPNKQLADFLTDLKEYMQNPNKMRGALVAGESPAFKFLIGRPLSDWNQTEVMEALNTAGWLGSVKSAFNTHCPGTQVHIWPLDSKKGLV